MSDVPSFLIDELFADTREGVIKPQIATLPNGNFLVTYLVADINGDRTVIFGQQYDDAGNKIGQEIVFETPPSPGRIAIIEYDMIVKPNGQVVLATRPGGIQNQPDIFAATYDLNPAGGHHRSVDFETVTLRFERIFSPTLSGYDNGDFNLFWHARTEVLLDASTNEVFDAMGTRGDDVIFRDADPFVGQRDADISAAVLNNNTTVVLLDRDSDFPAGLRSKFDVRFFDEDLKQFQFRELGGGARTFDTTIEALTGGGYAVAWSQLERVLLRSSDQDTEVFVQVFDEDGNPTSPKMRVGETRNNDLNTNASIVALDDGGFIVFYDKNRHEPSLNGQRYGEDGAKIGPEFRVFEGAVNNIDATLLPDNRVAVSFEADGAVRTETFDVDAILRAAEEAVFIVGTDEDDILEGGDGNDRFDGLDGDDQIRGGEGSDRIDGGQGFDTVDYSASNAAVQVSLQQGTEPQSGGHAEGDILRSVEGVVGSAFDDTITGNTGANVIKGLAGDDLIEGLGGADTINAGDGDDIVIVQDGANRSFDGGDGFDTLRVSDRVGLNGDDEVTNFEALEIIGTAGRNALLRLDADQVTFEQITYDSQNNRAVIIEVFGDGTEVLDLSTAELIGFDSQDEFRFFGSDTDETVTGTALNDRLEGRNGDDVLNGAGGNDLLRGGDGDDVIKGGSGDDTVDAGDGDDVIDGGAGADLINGGNGFDFVDYTASDAGIEVSLRQGSAPQKKGHAEGDILRSNIEGVIGSDFADKITGNDSTNHLVGGLGNDVLDGGGGRDILEGSGGDDLIIAINSSFAQTYDGGTGNDTLKTIGRVELRTDTIVSIENLVIEGTGGDALARLNASQMTFGTISFVPADGEKVQIDIHGDGTNVNLSRVVLNNFGVLDEFRFFGSNEAEGFNGTALNDQVNGGDGDDRLFGRAGDDVLNGDAGNDILEGNEGNDTLDGGTGNDILRGRQGDDVMDGCAGDDVMFGGDGADLLNGGAGNDRLDGGGGLDFLNGEDGDDELVGGASADTLSGGDGNDVIRGNGGDDVALGGNGDDLIFGSAGNDALFGDKGNDTLEGNEQSDELFGQDGNDILRGGDGFDLLDGGNGDDTLNGGNGNDVLIGGLGGDSLRGGDGNDIFTFLSVLDSRLGAEDVILDMQGVGAAGGDIIDLSAIDADQTQAGDQAFTFHGELTREEGLAKGAGALWTEQISGQTHVFATVNGDTQIDLVIRINDGPGISAGDYTIDEFLL